MRKAYVETTVLTDVLLKHGSKKQEQASQALARYGASFLPVYAIKEWKSGPLRTFAWLHDKLVITRSIRETLIAVNSVSPYKKYVKSTSQEALEAAARLEPAVTAATVSSADHDRELADRYRLALASLIIRSWKKRRSVATKTIHDLECYTEAGPRMDSRTGLLDIGPLDCEPQDECCLAAELRSNAPALRRLRDAIPETSSRAEDKNRRKALKQLINTPKLRLDRKTCRHLGDALFAFFCPDDCIVLTTNIRDHQPLTRALGKDAEKP